MEDETIENLTLWRYMSFEKFISLIKKQSLYFRRVDLFKEIDFYEGALSQLEEKLCDGDDITTNLFEDPMTGEKGLKYYFNYRARCVFANCWHNFEFENYLMWKVYGSTDTSIAMKIDLHNLLNCFNSSLNIEHHKVKYYNSEDLDLNTFSFSGKSDDAIQLYKRKRHFFQGEKEVRLFFCIDGRKLDKYERELEFDKCKKARIGIGDGVFIPINLKSLLKEVHLSPNSGKHFEELVKDLIDKYELECKIYNSRLNQKYATQIATCGTN